LSKPFVAFRNSEYDDGNETPSRASVAAICASVAPGNPSPWIGSISRRVFRFSVSRAPIASVQVARNVVHSAAFIRANGYG
jgi:hypothetical protein